MSTYRKSPNSDPATRTFQDLLEAMHQDQCDRLCARATEMVLASGPAMNAIALNPTTPTFERRRAFEALEEIERVRKSEEQLEKVRDAIRNAISIEYTVSNGTRHRLTRPEIEQIFRGCETWSMWRWQGVFADLCFSS